MENKTLKKVKELLEESGYSIQNYEDELEEGFGYRIKFTKLCVNIFYDDLEYIRILFDELKDELDTSINEFEIDSSKGVLEFCLYGE